MKAKKFTAVILLFITLFSYANAATCSTISQFGVFTWTFDRAYGCGQFANGDYWVIGPVTIIGIIPASVVIGGRTINGAMLDQLGNSDLRYSAPSGFDSAGPGWNSSLNVARPGGNDLSAGNPLIIGPNHSLISAISVAGAGARPQLSDAAILTILGSAPEPNSFRPPYSGTDKTIKFKVSDLDYSSLGSLATVTGPTVTPYQPQTYSLSTVEGWFERPWLDFQRFNDNLHPSNNMPGYGKSVAIQTSIGALTLQLNYTNAQKKTLMIRYAQLGIDLYGVLVQTNGGIIWEGGGAQSAGRKLPILFAGAVLNDADMKGIGNLPFHFGEDDQTFYVTSRDVYAKSYNLSTWRDVYTTGTIDVNYGETKVTGSDTLWSGRASGFFAVVGDNEANLPAAKAYKVASFDSNTQLTLSEPYRHSSVSGGSYKLSDAVYYGHAKADKIWQEGTTNADWVEFEDDDIGIPYWGIGHATVPIQDGKNWYTNYVHDNAAIYCGTQLSTLIMGLKTLWNHNAFFDYTDRWMTTEVGAIRSETDFSENMWDAYRANYGCIWTRDDSSPCTNTSDFSSSCYSQGHYNCSNCLYNCLSSPYCGDGTCNGNEDSKTCAWDCKTGTECSDGQTKQCGTTDIGECAFGTQTCINSTWGQCTGAINPTTESTTAGNCSDAKDNDCDGKTDTTDEGCQTPECIDEVKLLSNISEWKQGNITMLALMQKMKQWKAGTGC